MTAIPPPTSVNADNLSGKWVLDKDRTTGVQETFEVQGVPWLMRKMIAGANPVTVFKHNPPEVAMVTTAPGLPITMTETRRTDWKKLESKVAVFGAIELVSRILTFADGQVKLKPYDFTSDKVEETEADLEWLSAGWLTEGGVIKIWESQVKGLDNGWLAHQIWGFTEVDGERKHARKLVTWRKGKKSQCFLCYNYLGAADA